MAKTLSPFRFSCDKPKVCVATNGVAFFMRGSVWSHAFFVARKLPHVTETTTNRRKDASSMGLLDRNEKRFSEAENRARAELEKQGVSRSQIEQIINRIKERINGVPLPKIAIIGFTGVGKSTTLNALFNAGQPTSAIRACTQKEAPIIGNVKTFTGRNGSVIIYDMPGLGEDIETDKKHFATYCRVLPEVDVAIWTFHAGDRAMTPMQEALRKLVVSLGPSFQKKLMFAINKADAIAPGEAAWNRQLNSPSPEQKRNISELEDYIREKVTQILPNWNGAVITYSARQRYHLEQLMTAMVETMAKDRRWVLDSVADVADPTELMDARYLEYVLSQGKQLPPR